MADEVAKEKETRLTLKIKLDLEAVMAVQDLLSRSEPKGRSDMRSHSKLFREFNAKCRNYTNDAKTEFTWKTGEVEFTEESAIDFFCQILDKKIDAGVNGALSTGYSCLLDAVDEYKDAKKRK